jgi:hypothetical protein
MSTIKHPVGPQPGKVYWRRRLVVILGIVAVIVVILLIVLRPGASQGGTPAAVHTTLTPSASPSATHSTSSPAKTTIPTTKSTTAAGQPCTAGNVQVGAITDADSYAAGQLPKLSLSLTNTGTSSCTIDAGTAKQTYTITSGSEVYWKSTDCQVKPTNTVILLKPGKTLTSTPFAWDRTRSDKSSCTGKRPAVPAGGAAYHLETSVDGITSASFKQFLLD